MATDSEQLNFLPLHEQLMYAGFEDPSGSSGRVWVFIRKWDTPEYIVEAPHATRPMLYVFLPEQFEYTPRGETRHESVVIDR